MSEWQPIETAPPFPFNQERWFHNGPRMLLCSGRVVFIGSYGYTQKGKGRWQNEHGRNCYPTAWMPLPAPLESAT
jgi:hypothetical protein